MIKNSKEHLMSVNETYIQHLKTALMIGVVMIVGGLQALIHALYPGVLRRSASDKIIKLYEIVTKRS